MGLNTNISPTPPRRSWALVLVAGFALGAGLVVFGVLTLAASSPVSSSSTSTAPAPVSTSGKLSRAVAAVVFDRYLEANGNTVVCDSVGLVGCPPGNGVYSARVDRISGVATDGEGRSAIVEAEVVYKLTPTETARLEVRAPFRLYDDGWRVEGSPWRGSR